MGLWDLLIQTTTVTDLTPEDVRLPGPSFSPSVIFSANNQTALFPGTVTVLGLLLIFGLNFRVELWKLAGSAQ